MRYGSIEDRRVDIIQRLADELDARDLHESSIES